MRYEYMYLFNLYFKMKSIEVYMREATWTVSISVHPLLRPAGRDLLYTQAVLALHFLVRPAWKIQILTEQKISA